MTIFIIWYATGFFCSLIFLVTLNLLEKSDSILTVGDLVKSFLLGCFGFMMLGIVIISTIILLIEGNFIFSNTPIIKRRK